MHSKLFKLFAVKHESADLPSNFLKRVLAFDAAQGIVLFFCVFCAMVWANSPWKDFYFHLLHIPVSINVGLFELKMSLLHWINDGLMVFFFFLVGLEIKKEMASGELAHPKQAMFPMLAAIGGMMLPALIYLSFSQNDVMAKGWAVPTATDIAFAVGILSFVSNRIPPAVKVFLLAVAIIDDIGGILIIGLFYSHLPNMVVLGVALLVFLTMLAMNRAGVRSGIWYALLSIMLWFLVLKSGIHATLAGVMAALAIPIRPKTDALDFAFYSKKFLAQIEKSHKNDIPVLKNYEASNALNELKILCTSALTPLHSAEKKLHNFVSFVVLPIFALANAGVSVSNTGGSLFVQPIIIGVVLGLLIGKPLGIFIVSYLSVKIGLTQKPTKVAWKHIFGAGCLGGIGFTMALFIATLAFGESDFLDYAKIAILIGSFLSAILGLSILAIIPYKKSPSC